MKMVRTVFQQLYLNNQLTDLNVANGNNTNFFFQSVSPFRADVNTNLTCIEVDDPVYSSASSSTPEPSSSSSVAGSGGP